MQKNSPFRRKNIVFEILRALLRASRYWRVKLVLRQRFRVGSHFSMGKGADIRPPIVFVAGNHVGIGKNLTVEASVLIGDDVLLSSNVSLIGNDHLFDDPSSTVYWQGRASNKEIIIEGDNLLGFGVTVIGSVRIGKGCIVGAGSVVTKDLPPYTICAGVPARVIRARYPSAK